MSGHHGGSPASSKPHVLVLPFPLQGHITPLMQLSKLLAARGFDITFVTTHFNVAKMLKAKKAGLTHLHMGICLQGIPNGLPPSHPRDSSGDAEAAMASLLALHAPLDELVRQMVQEQGLHITCIISDSFLLWSQDAANKCRIPRISFWPQSLTAFTCSISLPQIKAAYPNLDPFNHEVYRNETCRVQSCIPGISDIAVCKLPFFSLDGDLGVNWLCCYLQVQMDRVHEPLCIICHTFPDLEQEVLTQLKAPLLCKPILTLGPLLPSGFLGGQDGNDDNGTGSSLHDEDEECLQWLNGQTPRQSSISL
ncbi:hypothetical protein GOP47_0003818 [Adiantum capillus-veneris]|uniref:Glycosyltransferase N-terminal domain-containing protein n=1 Tax=Adiantum capillus-veneris TaxID=13818 RepID=A0A9D4ZPS5_ADICA|nr:hypothetical protein GOP47_0003818 [Adiantum capillus-veneris]